MLEAALNRIGQLAGQSHSAEYFSVPHASGKGELTILVTRDGQGGMVTKDLTKDLERFDPNPARLCGTANHQTIDSLIAHVNRSKNAESSLWASRQSNNEAMRLTAVLNYHDRINVDAPKDDNPVAELAEPPMPQHSDHIALHDFPLSDELKAWKKKDGETLELLDFALFLEDHIMEVLPLPPFLTDKSVKPESDADKQLLDLMEKLNGNPCGPNKLMQLSNGLRINEDSKAEVFIDRNTGEHTIGFTSEHLDENGDKLVVPNMFLIAIPIFEGGEPYRIPVRLRMSKSRSSGANWKFEPYQLEKYIKHAFSEACEAAAAETALPLFFGEPEA